MMWVLTAEAQLGFCEGNKGDPIFLETFGVGTTNGPALPAGSTSYTFTNGTPDDGSYTISSTTAYFDWLATQDHTPGDVNGKAFIVNASFTAGEFFRREVTGLCENTSYEFSSWLLNLLPQSGCNGNGIPVNVKFQIWDATETNLLASGDTGNIFSKSSPIWENYGLVFQTSPGQSSIVLKMINNGNGGCGNDLAIDDITFSTCGDFIAITNDQNLTSIRICEDEIPVVTQLTANPDFSIYTTHVYQWQESTDRTNWIDIVGETNTSYAPPAISSSSFFRVKVAEDAVNLSNTLCNSVSEIFDVIIIPKPDAPMSTVQNIKLCPDNNASIVVTVPNNIAVNWYDSPIGGTLIQENSNSYIPNKAGIYYAEATSNVPGCTSDIRTAISVDFYDSPIVVDENISFCKGSRQTLSAGLANMQYLWNTGETTAEILVDAPGVYTVEVTNGNGCTSSKTVTLKEIEIPVIDRVISNDYTLQIITDNTGNFEYSLDGRTYQLSNTFNDVPGGRYTLYARNLEGCAITPVTYIHLVVPKYFTPNGDAVNDTFIPEGLDAFSIYEIQIFDRYGQLILSAANEKINWDGTFNNTALPSSDYWYIIKIEGARLQGHFTLKR